MVCLENMKRKWRQCFSELIRTRASFLIVNDVCWVKALLGIISGEILEHQSRLNDQHSFTWSNGSFFKDGQPFRYVSGSFHYSRVPASQWRDRLLKMKAGGLNAVQTYVMWNYHERSPGEISFDGNQDLSKFFRLINDLSLLAIVRSGPYVCAEWEFGGFPWHLAVQNMTLRSSDPLYLKYVDTWLSTLLPVIKSHLYSNGGPVIMVQIENEYGSYPTCDHNYMRHLEKKFLVELGSNVVLFTTDGNNTDKMSCGSLKTTLNTIDFGVTNYSAASFQIQREFSPHGPLVNSEFYTGWLNFWGQPFTHVDGSAIAQTLNDMLGMNASVNIYMYVGGSNFGYWSGSHTGTPGDEYDLTSYDYDAPISESGDTTRKYFLIKNTIEQYFPPPTIDVPANSSKASSPDIKMTYKGPLLSYLDVLAPSGPRKSKYPLSMEEYYIGYGMVLYRVQLTQNVPQGSVLQFGYNGVRDRAIIINTHQDSYVNLGSVDNYVNGVTSFTIPEDLRSTSFLDLIVENRGRINFSGSLQYQKKGIVGNVTLNGNLLVNWMVYQIDLSNLANASLTGDFAQSELSFPAVFTGTVDIQRTDTFLNTTSFSRGFAFMGKENLGRYWPLAGPQQTLFVPGEFLPSSQNIVTLFETEGLQDDSAEVDFLDYPILNGRLNVTFHH